MHLGSGNIFMSAAAWRLQMVYDGCCRCGDKFRETESIPYAACAKLSAEQIGSRHDHNYIAQQRNYQGMCSFSQTFQGARTGNGNSRHDKTAADDLQCTDADADGVGAVRK